MNSPSAPIRREEIDARKEAIRALLSSGDPVLYRPEWRVTRREQRLSSLAAQEIQNELREAQSFIEGHLLELNFKRMNL